MVRFPRGQPDLTGLCGRIPPSVFLPPNLDLFFSCPQIGRYSRGPGGVHPPPTLGKYIYSEEGGIFSPKGGLCRLRVSGQLITESSSISTEK